MVPKKRQVLQFLLESALSCDGPRMRPTRSDWHVGTLAHYILAVSNERVLCEAQPVKQLGHLAMRLSS